MKDSRRRFLSSCATAAAAGVFTPFFSSRATTLADEAKAKNDRVGLGLVGAGYICQLNMDVAKEWFDVVAIAEVDSARGREANERYGRGKAAVYDDYRRILERKDVDAVYIASPDHWHTKQAVEAMLAGKDIYCEKPLTLTIDEGKLIREVQRETGRIVQVGTQQRSDFPRFVTAMAIVAEGRLGRIKRVQAALGGAPASPSIPLAVPPPELDWDRWLGPAPRLDFRLLEEPANVSNEGKQVPGQKYTNGHFEFRWWYDFSGGKLTDWGAHHVDIAMWALRLNGQTAGPTRISGTARHPVPFKDGVPMLTDRYNTANEFLFTVDFPGGTELVIRHDTDNGVLIEGEKGRIFVNRRKLTGRPVEELTEHPLPEGAIAKVYKHLPMESNERTAHWANFLFCMKNGREPISDVHSHMKMLNICHLAGISGRLGRSLEWDDASERIVGDDQASAMLARPYRRGYEIERR